MKVGLHNIAEETILLKAISGSKAYGLDTPQSDTDIKGVFIQPKKEYYGLFYIEQVNNETNDIAFYELKRFFELLLKNNPNILELLATPEESILYIHPLFDAIEPELFLSKLCRQTFVQYAEAQIKKAWGLNKKIINPVDKERKTIAHFCYVVEGQGTISLNNWLRQNDFKQEDCGLSILPHMRDAYAIFHNLQIGNGYLKGIYSGEDANDVSLSSIPKNIKPLAVMSFNKDGYSVYCREYKEYWDWVGKRNESRYQNTLENNKNYDAKNMLHVFRLLNMAEDIALQGRVVVKRPEKDFLLRIKNGNYTYDYLLNLAKEKIEKVNSLFDSSSLQDRPDENAVNKQLIELREKFYSIS